MHTEYAEDKELIELAAKAIGLKLRYNYLGGRDANQPWNPLEDDGDALRLAVNLAEQYSQFHQIDWNWTNRGIRVFAAGHEGNGNDTYAATRKAITRAAAEIGRNMK